MSKIYDSIDQLIGNTPLLRLKGLEARLGIRSRILAKLEYFNPAGSVKDRAAKMMLDDAEESGALKPGSVIIEPTSGNTGIGLAAVAVPRGYRVIIVMPDNMSKERQLLMRAYGAEVVLTPASEGMAGAIKKAGELLSRNPGGFIPGQFENPSNPKAHRLSTGPEIFEATDGYVDYFVAGVGTGGTITGTGEYLKSKLPGICIAAVEPESSPVLSLGRPGAHGIQGIGANFVPKALNRDILDRIIRVSDEDAYMMSRLVAGTDGVLVGISSGAALFGAVKIAREQEADGKTIVCLLPDTGERYLSSGLFG